MFDVLRFGKLKVKSSLFGSFIELIRLLSQLAVGLTHLQ